MISRVRDIGNAWYPYVPSGTALLVVGVIGVLNFSFWRRNQEARLSDAGFDVVVGRVGVSVQVC
ncbi:hypothetical protein EDC04DRAFT_2755547 [Pisolithus marmoratus]|nr:hypothetical protein EDC04DRAFT_2755547 [Pisolithus marmoratus]